MDGSWLVVTWNFGLRPPLARTSWLRFCNLLLARPYQSGLQCRRPKLKSEERAVGLPRKRFLRSLTKEKSVSLGITGSPESISLAALSTVRSFQTLKQTSGGQMYLPAKFAVRIAFLSCCVLACAISATIHAQDPPQPKPTVEATSTPAEAKPDDQRKKGHLDGPVIVNTDLITADCNCYRHTTDDTLPA